MAFALPSAPAVEVRPLLERDGPRAVALQLLTLHPVEIAELLEVLDHEERFQVVSALPYSIAAQILLNGDSELRAGLLSRLSSESVADILDRLPVEHAAQLLEQLGDERQAEVLAASSVEDAAQMEAIRRCPPSSVGRLMVRRVPRIDARGTAADALRLLRRSAGELEAVNNLYVLDDDARLCGVVALRELVEADPSAPIAEMMQTRVVMVTPDTDREEAANLISRYNFMALPVVDANQRLLGVVTVDDLVDVLIREGTEDVLHLGAVSGGDDPEADTSYWAGRIGSAVRKRIGWLLLLFVAGTFTTSIMDLAEEEIGRLPALAAFIPLLIGTGGNAGSQTVTTIVRGLAVGEIRLRDALRVLVRESSTGVLLGLMLAVIGVARVLATGKGLGLALTVGVTMAVVCVWANMVGSMVPLLAKKLRIDPTVVSAPLITTVVDASGLVIYFAIARALLKL
jgi:magnesium transporter